MSDEQENLATFRFGVIAALVCRLFENKAQERTVRNEILSKLWKHPDGSMRKISDRTLRHWQNRYRNGGLDALFDGKRKPRKNKGISKAVPAEIIDEAVRLRKELPSRSVRTILQLLRSQNILGASVVERTLARQLRQRKATRQDIERGVGFFQRYEQFYANAMWQGDTAHGIWLPDPTNPTKLLKTKLIAFIDDATRVITHAQFYFDEQLPSLIDTFSKALLQRGRPARLLLDNAFIYHSNTLAGMCANLEIELSFCTPRRPQGKGKIERWIRTAKESFYPEAARSGITSLDELNRLFQTWLAGYHNKVHSELELTPLQRWLKDIERIRPVDPGEIKRALMLRGRRRVHLNTSCITLESEEYQVSSPYAGEMVEVRWHPDSLESVEIWSNGSFLEIAQRVVRRNHVEKKKFDVEEEAEYEPLTSSKNFFRSLEGPSPSTLDTPRNDVFLSLEEFQNAITVCLSRDLSDTELSRSRSFFVQFTPLHRQLTTSALAQAADVKGSHLHLRFYLQHVERIIQQNRRHK